MWSYVSTVLTAFRVESLDTRIRPPKDLIKKQAVINSACPILRWRTPEFTIYLLAACIIIPFMFKAGIDAAGENSPNFPQFAHSLSNGWIFGRKVDNTDTQYSFFRNNYLVLAAVMIAHILARRLIALTFNYKNRIDFDFCYGVAFLFVVHGINALKVFAHVFISYAIVKLVPSPRAALIVTWVYGVLTLFINSAYHEVPVGIGWIDNAYKGIVPRWDVFFNFTLLRMISFNYDFLQRTQAVALEKKENDTKSLENLEERDRLTAPLPLSDYGVISYTAYITYTPLLIAGPIITFNDYVYQSAYQQAASVKDYGRILSYFFRLVFCILVMEFLLHYMYVVAAIKAKAWEGLSPFEISMLGLFNLNIVWLKLLIPWRIFRFWGLIDGIDAPENMLRCMDNNYSALAFWRAWHRSYNRWVIRYIYVPLGGGGRLRIFNNLLVFTFVAVWHDIELKLLIWGWMISIFLIPELLATYLFSRYSDKWWYRHACAAGAVVNIWMMLTANLVGFCLGKDGTIALLSVIFKTASGLIFVVLASLAMFVGAQLMFEIRQDEIRRGINVRL